MRSEQEKSRKGKRKKGHREGRRKEEGEPLQVALAHLTQTTPLRPTLSISTHRSPQQGLWGLAPQISVVKLNKVFLAKQAMS